MSYLQGVPFPSGVAKEMPEFDIKSPSRSITLDFSSRLSPEISSTSGYLHKTAGFEIRVFPLATCSQQVVFAYDRDIRSHHGPSVDFPGESLGPATGGIVSNCPVPEAGDK